MQSLYAVEHGWHVQLVSGGTCLPGVAPPLQLVASVDGRPDPAGQWWHQCSKGARSFQGQEILQPAHPDALFSSK